MDRNPYAPPRSNVEVTPSGSQTTLPASRLYSPKQIAVATFLGSPLAGGWFMATNYRELGQEALATQAVWWGIAGGPLFSWWRVVGISLLCVAILLAFVFGVFFVLAMLGLVEF